MEISNQTVKISVQTVKISVKTITIILVPDQRETKVVQQIKREVIAIKVEKKNVLGDQAVELIVIDLIAVSIQTGHHEKYIFKYLFSQIKSLKFDQKYPAKCFSLSLTIYTLQKEPFF